VRGGGEKEVNREGGRTRAIYFLNMRGEMRENGSEGRRN